MKRVWGIFFWVGFLFCLFYCSIVFKFSEAVGWMAGKGSVMGWDEIMAGIMKGRGISLSWTAGEDNSITGEMTFDSKRVLDVNTYCDSCSLNLSVREKSNRTYDYVIWKGGGVREFTTPDIAVTFVTKLIFEMKELVQEIYNSQSMVKDTTGLSTNDVFNAFKEFVEELVMRKVEMSCEERDVDFDDRGFLGSPTGRTVCLFVPISVLGEGVEVKGHEGAVKVLMHGFISGKPGIYFINSAHKITGPAIRGLTVDELVSGLRKTFTCTKPVCVENALITGLSANFRRFVNDKTRGKVFEIYLYGNEFILWVSVDKNDMSLPVTYTYSLKANTETKFSGSVDCSDIRVGVAEIIRELRGVAISNSMYMPWQRHVVENVCSGGYLLITSSVTTDLLKGSMICNGRIWPAELFFSMDKKPDDKYECIIWRGGGVREVTVSNCEADVLHLVVPAIKDLTIEMTEGPRGVTNAGVYLSSEEVFGTLNLVLHGLVDENDIFNIPHDKYSVEFDTMKLCGSPSGIQPCIVVRVTDILKIGPIAIIGHDNSVFIVMHGFIRPKDLPGIYFTNGSSSKEIIGLPIRGRTVPELQHGLRKAITRIS
jgi:hypothetical protein